jgi:recombination protein RecT
MPTTTPQQQRQQQRQQRQAPQRAEETSLARKGAINEVRGALEAMKSQIALALPKHVTPERLLRVAMTSIQRTPKLLECDRTSLYAAVMTAAQLGLEPDGVLGQAYLVPFAGKVQFIPGYKGLITLARNSGEVSSIQAQPVCEGDEFSFSYGSDEHLHHVPALGERGKLTHFYAYARFKDGSFHYEVMSLAQVLAVRDGSKGWQAAVKYAKPGQGPDSPWHTHFEEMGRKTAIRRVAKYLPLSVQRAAAIDEAVERGVPASLGDAGEVVIPEAPPEGDVIDVTPEAPQNGSASRMDALAGAAQPPAAAPDFAAEAAEKEAAEAEAAG